MTRPGIGAMLHYLKGGSEHSSEEYEGMTIESVLMDNNKLKLTFNNGKRIIIFDDGQSCCEDRYMKTDDDIRSLVGGKLVHISAKEGPKIKDDDYNVHEQIFIEIATDKGFITLNNHNEHNGYYGGFGLTIKEEN